LGRELEGGDDGAAATIEVEQLFGGIGGERIAGGQNQDTELLAVFLVVDSNSLSR